MNSTDRNVLDPQIIVGTTADSDEVFETLIVAEIDDMEVLLPGLTLLLGLKTEWSRSVSNKRLKNHKVVIWFGDLE